MKDVTGSDFTIDGALLFRGAIKSCLADLEAAVAGISPDAAGVRIHGLQSLRRMVAVNGCIGAIAASVLGPSAKAVRAILFNKSMERNWSLGWHQDRTICVKERRELPGFGPWTMKRGMNHVEPPFDYIARMVTVRAHLDTVPATNAPLMIAPGSHTLGRIPVSQVDDAVARCGTRVCLAEAADAWLYATPILHASGRASDPTNRRVLQVDFATEALPTALNG